MTKNNLLSPIRFQSPLDIIENSLICDIPLKTTIQDISARAMFSLGKKTNNYKYSKTGLKISGEDFGKGVLRGILGQGDETMRRIGIPILARANLLHDFQDNELMQDTLKSVLITKFAEEGNIISLRGSSSVEEFIQELIGYHLPAFFSNYKYWQPKDCDKIFEAFLACIGAIEGGSLEDIKEQISQELKQAHPTTFMWAADYKKYTDGTNSEILKLIGTEKVLIDLEAEAFQFAECDIPPKVSSAIQKLKGEARGNINKIMERPLTWRLKDFYYREG